MSYCVDHWQAKAKRLCNHTAIRYSVYNETQMAITLNNVETTLMRPA